MNKKHLFVTLVAAFLFVSIGYAAKIAFAPVAPVSIVPEAQAMVPAQAPAYPVEIIIPTASVDAPVIPVGVTATNNLDVPHNFVQTGWYKNGTIPGEAGSAVIDGHVDNAGSIPGPFKHLRNVAEGDIVTVKTSTGTTENFKVTSIDIYNTNTFPSGTIFANTSQSLLKIITCHGTYVPSAGTYNQRLVVTAELVS